MHHMPPLSPPCIRGSPPSPLNRVGISCLRPPPFFCCGCTALIHVLAPVPSAGKTMATFFVNSTSDLLPKGTTFREFARGFCDGHDLQLSTYIAFIWPNHFYAAIKNKLFESQAQLQAHLLSTFKESEIWLHPEPNKSIKEEDITWELFMQFCDYHSWWAKTFCKKQFKAEEFDLNDENSKAFVASLRAPEIPTMKMVAAVIYAANCPDLWTAAAQFDKLPIAHDDVQAPNFFWSGYTKANHADGLNVYQSSINEVVAAIPKAEKANPEVNVLPLQAVTLDYNGPSIRATINRDHPDMVWDSKKHGIKPHRFTDLLTAVRHTGTRDTTIGIKANTTFTPQPISSKGGKIIHNRVQQDLALLGCGTEVGVFLNGNNHSSSKTAKNRPRFLWDIEPLIKLMIRKMHKTNKKTCYRKFVTGDRKKPWILITGPFAPGGYIDFHTITLQWPQYAANKEYPLPYPAIIPGDRVFDPNDNLLLVQSVALHYQTTAKQLGSAIAHINQGLTAVIRDFLAKAKEVYAQEEDTFECIGVLVELLAAMHLAASELPVKYWNHFFLHFKWDRLKTCNLEGGRFTSGNFWRMCRKLTDSAECDVVTGHFNKAEVDPRVHQEAITAVAVWIMSEQGSPDQPLPFFSLAADAQGSPAPGPEPSSPEIAADHEEDRDPIPQANPTPVPLVESDHASWFKNVRQLVEAIRALAAKRKRMTTGSARFYVRLMVCLNTAKDPEDAVSPQLPEDITDDSAIRDFFKQAMINYGIEPKNIAGLILSNFDAAFLDTVTEQLTEGNTIQDVLDTPSVVYRLITLACNAAATVRTTTKDKAAYDKSNCGNTCDDDAQKVLASRSTNPASANRFRAAAAAAADDIPIPASTNRTNRPRAPAAAADDIPFPYFGSSGKSLPIPARSLPHANPSPIPPLYTTQA